MSDDKIKSIIITGPTASGKTSMSLKVAKVCKGEILCCDSMQIYRGMDIGTAKATPEEKMAATHHLIDIVEPWEDYSVADYCKAAELCSREVFSRGQTPIFVGGTGLYITSLVEGFSYDEESDSDKELYEKLTVLAGTDSGMVELYGFLQEHDPEAAAKIHINNKKRVIRAVELYKLTGKSQAQRNAESKKQGTFLEPVVFAMDMDREQLYRRINMRVDMMLEEGLVEEVRRVLQYCKDNGKILSKTASQAIGYKETILHLEGQLTRQELSEQIKLATRHYAKRQLTWLRKWPWVIWVDCDKNPYEEIMLHLSKNTYNFS